MKIPTIHGLIDRRILVNYRVDAAVMERVLPPPFRPKTVRGWAMGGICLIRLKKIRPRFVPFPWGLRSENAAHRIAVEWDVDGATREGVYIPRRDTDSRLSIWVGGRLFPGQHHRAYFAVEESADRLDVALCSDDGDTHVRVRGHRVENFPSGSVFASLAEASAFFEAGSLGYSATAAAGRYEGLELRCQHWQVTPLAVEAVASSYFEDAARFPSGSVHFDSALLMRGIAHEWHGREDLCCGGNAA